MTESYLSLFNGIPVALGITEVDGRFVDVNETFCKKHGYTRDELIGKLPSEAGVIDFDIRELVVSEFLKNNLNIDRLEITTRTKSREIYNCLLSVNQILLNGGTYFLVTLNDITAQRKAESKLHESTIHIRRITDNVPGLLYEYVLRGAGNLELQFVSNGSFDLLGYTPLELMSQNEAVLNVHPDDYEAVMQEVRRSIKMNCSWSVEYRIRHKNGNYVWVAGRSSAYRTDDNGDVWISGSMSDITERKEMEASKERSEQRLHQTIDMTPNLAIQWYNREGVITFWNPASERMYGFSAEEALGKTLDKLIHTPEETANFLTYLHDIEKSGEPVGPYECPVRNKNGEIKIVLATTFMIPGDDHNPTFVCMDYDITEQKRLELESRKAGALHKAILDSAGYPVIAADINGIITHFNHAAERMLGYTSEEMVGIQTPVILHDFEELEKRSIVLSEELGRMIRPGLEVFTARSLQGLSDEYEYTYVRKDGTEFPVLLSVTAMRDKEGEIVGFLGVAADLTERHDAEERLKKKNEELVKINTELDRFVYSASHDLRAPVTSMLGLIDIAKLETDPNQLFSYLDKQRKTMIKMDEFIHEIVNFSRNGRLTITKELVDVKAMAEDIFEQYNYLEKASRIEKTVEVTLHAPLISDRQRISIILSNLISNSIKYSDLTKEKPFLKISVVVDEDEAILVVKDNGEGIRKEYQPKIFQMFYRATLNSTGSGLGLYIVKEVMEKLGGTIELHSTYGEGTTLEVKFPNRINQ